MGSNVFKLPGAGIFSHTANPSGAEAVYMESRDSKDSKASLFPAFTVPSFRRRTASSPTQAASSGEQWAHAARRRAALRLVESSFPASLPTSATCRPPLPAQPLRVMRLVEAGQAPGTAGRLRLSGRLADVCAELDRMAAAESGPGPHALRA